MYKFTITINPEAQLEHFQYWLDEQYPDMFLGISTEDGLSYVSVLSNDELTLSQKNAIAAYYAGMTAEDDIFEHYCTIFSYIKAEDKVGLDQLLPPESFDYSRGLTTRLHPIITTVVKGEVRQIVYYAEASLNQYGQVIGSIPVVKEDMVYTRDVAKMALSRTMTISWYRNDGTLHPATKVLEKFYSPQERIAEGQRLRTNIIDFCQPNVLGMLMATEQLAYDDAVTSGSSLFRKYNVKVSEWIAASRGSDLVDILTADTEFSWLDNVINANGTTIRMYIIDQLNY